MSRTDEEEFFEAQTIAHINEVALLLDEMVKRLRARARSHDYTKLASPERETFIEYTPKLRDLDYGSPKYKRCLEEMKVALKHHYANNRHHPEHFEDGILGMTLIDLLEMMCDWRAATKRHVTGDIRKSLEHNAKRFEIPEPIQRILENTARDMGWISKNEEEKG